MIPVRVGARTLVDLLSSMDPTSKPRYLALADQLEQLIRGGRIVPDALLPGAHMLATRLGTSRATVDAAYRQLVERGVVAQEHGRATRVLAAASPITGPREAQLAQTLPAATIVGADRDRAAGHRCTPDIDHRGERRDHRPRRRPPPRRHRHDRRRQPQRHPRRRHDLPADRHRTRGPHRRTEHSDTRIVAGHQGGKGRGMTGPRRNAELGLRPPRRPRALAGGRWRTIGGAVPRHPLVIGAVGPAGHRTRQGVAGLPLGHAGYGQSAKSPRHHVSIAAQTELFDALLNHWKLDAPQIVAHDIGGAVALRTHLLHHQAYRPLT